LVCAAVVVVTVGVVVQALVQMLPVLLIAGAVLVAVRIRERRNRLRPALPTPPPALPTPPPALPARPAAPDGWVWVPVWHGHLPLPPGPPIIDAEAVDDP
jgi:hypothetical protein